MKRCNSCGNYISAEPTMPDCCSLKDVKELTPMVELKAILLSSIENLKQASVSKIPVSDAILMLVSLIQDLDEKYIQDELTHIKEAVLFGHKCSHINNVKAISDHYVKERYYKEPINPNLN